MRRCLRRFSAKMGTMIFRLRARLVSCFFERLFIYYAGIRFRTGRAFQSIRHAHFHYFSDIASMTRRSSIALPRRSRTATARSRLIFDMNIPDIADIYKRQRLEDMQAPTYFR